MFRRSILAMAILILVSGPAAAQTCEAGCGECNGDLECLGLPGGSACTIGGEAGTCVLICPTEGNCCGCDTSMPPDVPASSGPGIVLLVVSLAAASMTIVWRRMRSHQTR